MVYPTGNFFFKHVESKAYYFSQVIDLKFSLSTQAWFDQSDQLRMDQFEPLRQFSDLEPSLSINHAPFEAVKISSTKQMCETRSLLRYRFLAILQHEKNFQMFSAKFLPAVWAKNNKQLSKNFILDFLKKNEFHGVRPVKNKIHF